MIFDFGLIAANNGWAMAASGAAIVVIGLSLLALIISQLHKVVAVFEKKAPVETVAATAPHADLLLADQDLLNDVEAAARLYKILSEELGSSFKLASLYRLLERDQLPHPHLTIRALRDSGFLHPTDKGKFVWHNV